MKNQFGAENKSCPEFDFTSEKVLQIFLGGQIFLILKIKIFKLDFLKKPSVKNFLSNYRSSRNTSSIIYLWQFHGKIFFLLFNFVGGCVLVWFGMGRGGGLVVRWLMSSYVKRKVLWWWWHCNYSSRSRSLYEIDLEIWDF